MPVRPLICFLAAIASVSAFGQSEDTSKRLSVADLTASVRDSIVVIQTELDSGESTLGTGFVISQDGLIATNQHVIGTARPLTVETRMGNSLPVVEVHATETAVDLAIIRVEASEALPAPLPLGDSSTLRQGQEIIAIGHPLGDEHQVVEGIVSAIEEYAGNPVIRLAIPIERGNSGGPLIDLQGEVHGILTLKSLERRDLGFAVPINALKPLLENPNPVPMDRWLQIGRLDTTTWEPVFGADWRQRSGRLFVRGAGSGFGGRSLCLRREIPPTNFELSVEVRMNDESGAAGLVFQADGEDRHYGFYPSGGRIRLTRFSGPSVYQWDILSQLEAATYEPGNWNRLRVQVTGNGMRCFVNDALLVESEDSRLAHGRVGVAKFRDTLADFRNFTVTKLTSASSESQSALNKFASVSANARPAGPRIDQAADSLLSDEGVTASMLNEKAQLLEARAREIRELSGRLIADRGTLRLVEELAKPAGEVDLLKAALLIAQLDGKNVDIPARLAEVDRMADAVREALPDSPTDEQILDALNEFLFTQNGFHGNRTEYYKRTNSYMDDVLYGRTGLPITLSILYMSLADRLGISVVGIGLPGHFVTRFEPVDDAAKPKLIDVFERGRVMPRDEAEALIRRNFRGELREEFFEAQSARDIIRRMLVNLLSLAEARRDTARLLRYLNTLVAIQPDSVEFRAKRFDLRVRTERYTKAIEDIDWFVEEKPDGVDIERLGEFRTQLVKQLDQQPGREQQ